jgi:hypothetical protein
MSTFYVAHSAEHQPEIDGKKTDAFALGEGIRNITNPFCLFPHNLLFIFRATKQFVF